LNSSILESISKGKLDDMRYPICSDVGGNELYRGHQGPIDTLIVFMVGGVTYEEAREVANFWNAEPMSKQ